MLIPIRPPNFPTFNLPDWGGIRSPIPQAGWGAAAIDPNALRERLKAGGFVQTIPPGGATTQVDPAAGGAGAGTGAGAGAGMGRWEMPDYDALLRGDPGYIGELAGINASEGASGRDRSAAIRRAIAQFGGAPAGWQSGFGDVDEAALAAAASNPNSTLKQLERTRSTGRADLGAALGARGMLQSGALTGGEQAIQRGYESASADATQQLLDALSGYEGAYTEGLRQSEMQRLNALANAGDRVRQRNPARWIMEAGANLGGGNGVTTTGGGVPPAPPIATPPVGAGTGFAGAAAALSGAQIPSYSNLRLMGLPPPSRTLIGRLQRAGGWE